MTVTSTPIVLPQTQPQWSLSTRLNALALHEKRFLIEVLAVSWAKELSIHFAIDEAYPEGLPDPTDAYKTVDYSAELDAVLDDCDGLNPAQMLRLLGDFAMATAEIETGVVA